MNATACQSSSRPGRAPAIVAAASPQHQEPLPRLWLAGLYATQPVDVGGAPSVYGARRRSRGPLRASHLHVGHDGQPPTSCSLTTITFTTRTPPSTPSLAQAVLHDFRTRATSSAAATTMRPQQNPMSGYLSTFTPAASIIAPPRPRRVLADPLGLRGRTPSRTAEDPTVATPRADRKRHEPHDDANQPRRLGAMMAIGAQTKGLSKSIATFGPRQRASRRRPTGSSEAAARSSFHGSRPSSCSRRCWARCGLDECLACITGSAPMARGLSW